jgi:hypothetical protein
MASFDFTSFVIGLLIGMIVMLLLVWIAYYTRSFLFTNCPTTTPACAGADYYNNPGDAIANGAEVDDILFINQDQLFYKRVPRVSGCVPESNQVVYIQYPQYCSFTTEQGTTETGKALQFNSPLYQVSGVANTVLTTGDCDPAPGTGVVSGVPLLEWDPNPISD